MRQNEDEEDPQEDEDEAPEKPNYFFVIVATHVGVALLDAALPVLTGWCSGC